MNREIDALKLRILKVAEDLEEIYADGSAQGVIEKSGKSEAVWDDLGTARSNVLAAYEHLTEAERVETNVEYVA